jgi:hypothetical protein
MTARRNANNWTFTRHALERAVDMALDPDELRKVIERPTRPLPSFNYPGEHLIFGERIVLCVNLEKRIVITIVWNTSDGQTCRRLARDTPEELERCRDSA